MCKSRLDIILALLSLGRELHFIHFGQGLENVRSYRVARTKIAPENFTIVHSVGSHNLPQGAYESAF